MKNDWFVSEESDGSNPDIYIESRSQGTICEISGGLLEVRRARARLIAKAPALRDLPDLLEACEKATRFYEWIIADWGAKLDPDGDLPPELATFRREIARVKSALSDDVPDIFEGETL